ncbi:MAG TPA: UDP-2,3-diacylglucosamine diphosphatase LpxI [Kiritimatiellia bacterium]|nr:UDP-2,3-diacylglucosamine diphosphatase LpxI [Kiritimatiellia bacterium]HPW74549.1 UDP-2,3-diacylglucosamine diphosphatase LpxI [Kiritimatiellia bacterium]
MTTARQVTDNLFIVAGNGTYPACVATGARRAGIRHITMLALRGATSRATAALADEIAWFGVGEVRRIFDWIARQGFPHAILAGGIPPIALFRTRFDDLARAWLNELPVKNAHTLFGRITTEIERLGIRVLPASCYMDDFLPGAGVFTRRGPTEREARDIDFGHRVACGIGGHDIGQTLVVKDGMILAVEAFEGTDAAICRGGKLGGPGAVVVKVAKTGHDMRFDIPVIGKQTIRVLRRARISALAFQAGRLVMLERDKVLAAADRLNLTVVGLDSGLPTAPMRP